MLALDSHMCCILPSLSSSIACSASMLDQQAFKAAMLPRFPVVSASLVPPSKLLPADGRLHMSHSPCQARSPPKYVFQAVSCKRGEDKSRARAPIVKRRVTFAERM
jgi:hypothetical protein